MIRLAGRVTLTDGTELEFETGSASLAAWERYALKHGYPIGADQPPILSSLVVAHRALGRDESLEDWFELVEDVELAEKGAVPPTRAAASTG